MPDDAAWLLDLESLIGPFATCDGVTITAMPDVPVPLAMAAAAAIRARLAQHRQQRPRLYALLLSLGGWHIDLEAGEALAEGCHGITEDTEAVTRLPAGLALQAAPPSPGGRRVEATPSLPGVLDHEMGHALEQAFAEAAALAEPGWTLEGAYAAAGKEAAQRGLSGYVGQDCHEWLAESLAAWLHPQREGAGYDIALAPLFERVLGDPLRADAASSALATDLPGSEPAPPAHRPDEGEGELSEIARQLERLNEQVLDLEQFRAANPPVADAVRADAVQALKAAHAAATSALYATPETARSAERRQVATTAWGAYRAACKAAARAGKPMARLDAGGQWDESAHPRGGEGTKEGGQFVAKGQATTPTEKEAPKPHETAAAAAAVGWKPKGDMPSEVPTEPEPDVQATPVVGAQAMPGAPPGKGSSKDDLIASVPKPTGWLEKQKNKAAYTIVDLAEKGIKGDELPAAIADKIKAIGNNSVHPVISKLANSVLAHLETGFGLAKGSLGQAKPKVMPAKGQPQTAPAPASKPATPAPHPAAAPAGTGFAPGEDWAKKVAAKPPEPAPPSDDEMEKMAAADEPAPDMEGDPLEEGPEPHSGSPGQEKIYTIATYSGLNTTQKAEAIQKVMEDPAFSGPYTKKFGEDWLKALGTGQAAPAEAKPATPAAPKPAAKPAAKPQANPYLHQTSNQMRLARGQKLRAAAKDVTSAGAPGAAKICPTLSRKWWDTAPQEGRAAVASYKAGSGSINGALRDAETKPTSKHIQAEIDHLDELFELDDAKLTEDVILRRGETVPAEQINDWITALAAGKPVRPQRKGFVSTSMASKAAFGGNVTYEIIARKGTPAIGAWAATDGFFSENEVMLRHGSVFEVYEIEQLGGKHIVRCMTM